MKKIMSWHKKPFPLFSVILLHYKQPDYWQEAVDSVLLQKYPHIQLIFSDDATPGFRKAEIEAYIRKYKKKNIEDVIVRSNIQNLGTAGNCDNAVEFCSGEYVLILDGDDTLAAPNVLTEFVLAFSRLPESENIVTANCEICDAGLQNGIKIYCQEDIRKRNVLTAKEQFQNMYLDFFPVPSATAFKRRIYGQCGNYAVPFVRLSQDGYYFIHVSRLGNKFNLINMVACRHRAGGVCNPTAGKISPSGIAVKEEFLRIAEFEIFPYFKNIDAVGQNAICQRYYENLIAYRQISGDLIYGISEPAYSILHAWAKTMEIPWFFPKSKLCFFPEDEIWDIPLHVKGIQIKEKEKCCGCTACMAVCPQNAIQMTEDVQGFQYPLVDQKLCTDCGLCNKVCPMLNQDTAYPSPLSYLAMKHKNNEIRNRSRSGGFFAALAELVLQQNGVVYGAAYREDLSVSHIRINQIRDIPKLQGSKYVQSALGNCFTAVKNDLNEDRIVLFSGTPCQVDGLTRFLQKLGSNLDNLILLDIVCHGAPSPKLFREYLDYCERHIQKPILSFDFRDKEKGWRSHIEKITTLENGTTEKIYMNEYTSLFYQHNIFRPTCYQCPYACYERISDLTIADYWGVEKSLPEFDDDKGVSLVMPHTKKGMHWLQLLQPLFEYREITKSMSEQPTLNSPSVRGKNYASFWSDYKKGGLESVIKKYTGKESAAAVNKAPVRTVGILTFHRAHNYGAMLQAWALLTHLQKCGYSTRIIDYRCKEIEDSYRFIPWQIIPDYCQFKTPDDPKRGLKMYVEVWKETLPALFTWWRRWLHFTVFLKKNLHIYGKGYSHQDLSNLPYDAVICGSDQIWATEDPAYYAAFETEARKIAYAPSMGNRVFPPEFHKTVYHWLHAFSFLSVREESMISYLQKAFGVSPSAVTLDPTLLLYGGDYDILLPPLRKVPESYIFCYCVTDDDAMIGLAKRISDQRNCSLHILQSWQKKEKEGQIQDAMSGPARFLDYIKNADYVITNSFHGTVFSILYHKQFYSIYGEGMNKRIDDLLSSLHLQNRHITDELPSSDLTIQWETVEVQLEKMRLTSFDFLDEALKTEGGIDKE